MENKEAMTNSTHQMRLQIIGGGNMGEAIIKGLIKTRSESPNFDILVVEKNESRIAYLEATYPMVRFSRVIEEVKDNIVATKPNDVAFVLGELSKSKIELRILSIAAGIKTAYIESFFTNNVAVLRAMPNTPCQIGKGVIALCKGKYSSKEDLAWAKKLLMKMGKILFLKEEQFDLITAVSGSGPAYVFLFAEALVEAAEHLGLDEKSATDIVIYLLTGSSLLLEVSKREISELRHQVTSPGGTTQAAIEVLEKNGFRELIFEAVKAACQRSAELGSHR